MKIHELLNENANQLAMNKAASFLDTQPNELVVVDDDTAEKVLKVGKEVKSERIKMGLGNILIRVFNALRGVFVRIETSDGKKIISRVMFKSKSPANEARILEKWNDSGASDAEGRWARYRDGDIGVLAMAAWLYNSRVHKKTKDEKLKSAYGAISQQQNTSKLISAAKADALRAALKKKFG